MDDSEPGRCRRTDGKKWRCKKEVLTNEKYCEKHMHRGCRRGSRKLVESSSFSASPKLISLPTSHTTTTTTTAAAAISSSKKCPSSDLIKVDSNESRPTFVINPPKPKSSPLSLQLKIQPPNGTTSSHHENIAVGRVKEGVNKGSENHITPTRHYPVMTKVEVKSAPPRPATATTVSAYTGGGHFILSKRSRDTVKGGNGSSCGKDGEMIIDDVNTKSSKSMNCVTTNASSALDFSPKSVLRDGQVCSSAPDLHMLKSLAEFDSQRCRRTDGKRWRCSQEVVDKDQKYCAKHMHRGAKKRPIMGEASPYGSHNGGSAGKSDCDLRLYSNLDSCVKQAKKFVLGMEN